MLKNSKAFKFLIGTFAVLAIGFALNASAAMDFGSATLKVGSKGEYVKTLQTLVGASPVDGIFGNGTKAKVKAWQANNGLTADGKFGPASKAKANEVGMGSGSGALCPNGMTLASNCTAAPSAGGSAALCPNGMTLASNCTQAPSGTVNTGTNGYLADISADSTNRVTKVYESEQDKVVAGMRATARLSSQNVNRVRVTMVNTNTSSSANLAKYISSASLWYGSTKIATMAVAQADRATSTDKYTFNFSGLSANIPQDQIGRFYVSVSANGSLDSTDVANASWTVTFLAGGLQAVSPDGSVDTYPSADIAQTGLTFGKFSSSGVKAEVTLSSSNPAAATIPVSSTNTTNGVELLKFKVKAVNSDLTIRKVPVQITISSTTAGDDLEDVINTVKLMQGSNVVDTVDGSAGYQFTAGSESTSTSGTACTTGGSAADDLCTFYFSNLSSPYNAIASGATAEYSVIVDLKSQANYTAGTTVSASLPNVDVLSSDDFSVQDMNGDQLTDASSSVRVGSAVGETMTLRVNGVNTVMGTPTYGQTTDTNGNVTSVTYTIPVAVTSFGNTLYIGQAAELATTVSGSNAFGIVLELSNAPTSENVSATTSITLSTSDASVESNGFRLDSGTTKHFTINVTVSAATNDKSIRVRLDTIQTFTEGGLVTGTVSNLLPTTNYRTDYKYLYN